MDHERGHCTNLGDYSIFTFRVRHFLSKETSLQEYLSAQIACSSNLVELFPVDSHALRSL